MGLHYAITMAIQDGSAYGVFKNSELLVNSISKMDLINESDVENLTPPLFKRASKIRRIKLHPRLIKIEVYECIQRVHEMESFQKVQITV